MQDYRQSALTPTQYHQSTCMQDALFASLLASHTTFKTAVMLLVGCEIFTPYAVKTGSGCQWDTVFLTLNGIMVTPTSGYSITWFNEWKKIATCKLPGLFWWQVCTSDSYDGLSKDSSFSLFSSLLLPVIMINRPAKFLTAFQSRFSAVCNLAKQKRSSYTEHLWKLWERFECVLAHYGNGVTEWMEPTVPDEGGSIQVSIKLCIASSLENGFNASTLLHVDWLYVALEELRKISALLSYIQDKVGALLQCGGGNVMFFHHELFLPTVMF